MEGWLESVGSGELPLPAGSGEWPRLTGIGARVLLEVSVESAMVSASMPISQQACTSMSSCAEKNVASEHSLLASHCLPWSGSIELAGLPLVESMDIAARMEQLGYVGDATQDGCSAGGKVGAGGSCGTAI